jgi:hypothetical protein
MPARFPRSDLLACFELLGYFVSTHWRVGSHANTSSTNSAAL